jgi:hypothetical protein
MLFFGCDTRREVLNDQGVWVRVEVDWKPAGILPNGTSIYLFDRETGSRTAILRTNDMRDSIASDSFNLHTGRYSLFVFNETERSHDNISFRRTDNYLAAEAYSKPAAALRTNATPMAMTIDDVLAVSHIDLFEVDYDLIRSQQQPTLRLTPQRLTVATDIIVHVQNIRSLHTGALQAGSLDNMAEGAFLATEAPNGTPVEHWFTFTVDSYDADTNSGALKASFASFGPIAAADNLLSLYFRLRDGTEHTIVRDVTSQIHAAATTPVARLKIEIGLAPADYTIELPDLPGGDGGMFDVDVGGWDSNTEVDIPI